MSSPARLSYRPRWGTAATGSTSRRAHTVFLLSCGGRRSVPDSPRLTAPTAAADPLQVQRELGRGTWGTVLLAHRHQDGCFYALKVVQLDKRSTRDQMAAVQECQVGMCLLGHHRCSACACCPRCKATLVYTEKI